MSQNKNLIVGNKGEWSEIYVFFKLLSDCKVYNGDENIKINKDLFYPIIKILREDLKGKFTYQIGENVIYVIGDNIRREIPILEFSKMSKYLFQSIINANGVFSLPIVEEFMTSIYCDTLKAKSIDKTDIKIVIHDLRTSLEHLLGFSIKSKLGSPSTLLNASGDATNLVYQIEGISNDDANKINNLKKFQDKFQFLTKLNAKVSYVTFSSVKFLNNLLYVDYCLPNIIGEMTLLYYSNKYSNISEIIEEIKKKNPLNFDLTFGQDFYEHKIKVFLTDVALGLKTGKPWKGIYEATGGYLIVREDGDILCYHIYNINDFQNYLFHNTRLETPSTSRHKFGYIFEKDNKFFMKLNLQIRFL